MTEKPSYDLSDNQQDLKPPQVESADPADAVMDSEKRSDTAVSEIRVVSRGATSDPFFGFLLAIALSIGLIPLLPDHADLRYTLAWGTLAGISILAWLLGSTERISQERPENIAWGIIYGLMLGIPLLLFLRPILVPLSRQVFPEMSAGGLLAYLIFVMPIAETLFFRGLLQSQLVFWVIGLLAALWNMMLFFPVMWQSVLQFPAVAAVIAIVLLMMNMIYVYVRERNGLAAAWICQIVTNLIILYIPFLSALLNPALSG